MYANLAQVLGQVHLADELVDLIYCLLGCAPVTLARACYPHRFRGLGQLRRSHAQVETHRMRQDDTVSNTMRHACRPAQHVAKPVVEPHSDMSQRRSGQERSHEHLSTRLQVITRHVTTRQRRIDSLHSTQSDSRGERVTYD